MSTDAPPNYSFPNLNLSDVQSNPPPNSRFAERFNIPSIASDIVLWDQTWEQTLPTLSASQDVYPVLSTAWLQTQETSPGFLRIRSNLTQVQSIVTTLWQMIADDRRPLLSWMHLSEKQRMQHMLFGLHLTCQYTSCGQDARAMCPEITTSALLQDGGKAYIQFFRTYSEGITSAAHRRSVYILPSEWWAGAIGAPHPGHEQNTLALVALTLQRNEFIGQPRSRILSPPLSLMTLLCSWILTSHHDVLHGWPRAPQRPK